MTDTPETLRLRAQQLREQARDLDTEAEALEQRQREDAAPKEPGWYWVHRAECRIRALDAARLLADDLVVRVVNHPDGLVFVDPHDPGDLARRAFVNVLDRGLTWGPRVDKLQRMHVYTFHDDGTDRIVVAIAASSADALAMINEREGVGKLTHRGTVVITQVAPGIIVDSAVQP